MAAGKFSFMDIMNAQSKDSVEQTIDKYTEIYLNPADVKTTESNFYSQDNIQELADSILTVGQQQPTVLGRVNGEYRIISGHRRNLANLLLIEQGHEEYKSVRYLYRDMSEAMLELSLLVGNAYNRELSAWEKTEQAARLKAALIKARDEDGLEIQGKLRDIIAEMLGESATNVARMESINNNLTDGAKEQFKNGNIGVTAAYEASKLSEAEQQDIADAAAAGENVRAKEIAEKVAAAKAGDAHPESELSICYSCINYKDCNVKTGNCKNCDTYVNKADAEKTDEQRYSEEQDDIDRETARKLRDKADEEKLEHLPSEAGEKTHDIKLAATWYNDVHSGKKKFELRKNDRDYKVGDKLIMHEVCDGMETGRLIKAKIVYMLEEYKGLEESYCILGTELLPMSETDTSKAGQE